MNIIEAHRRIWEKKLVGIEPPSKQHIDRCTWTASLISKVEFGLLLDIGCGSGAMLHLARGLGYYPTGIDCDGELIEWIKSQDFDAYQMDLNSENFTHQDCTIDAATCCDVIEHLIDPLHMLKEAYRVLKPGARLYVGTPNMSCWRRVVTLDNGTHPRTSGDNYLKDGGHVGYYGPNDLTAILNAAGFKSVEIKYFNEDKAKSNLGLFNHPWSNFTYQIAVAQK